MAEVEDKKNRDDVDAEKDDKQEESNPASADFEINDKADLIKVLSTFRDRLDQIDERLKEPNDSKDSADSKDDDSDDEYSDLDDLLK